MMLSITFGATKAMRLISSSAKNLLAILIMPLLPILLLGKLLPIVIWFFSLSSPSKAATLNNLSEGI